MRPTKSSIARSSAVIAAAFVVNSFAQAGVFKASPCQVPQLREAILQQVNAVRARGYNCGSESFKSAPAIAWNSQLVKAAETHSVDMAEHDYFSHANPRGARVSERADAVGYAWRTVGENIAAGQFTPGSVMKGWMDSPSHCRNIMNPGYSEIGVACIGKAGTTYGEYWTMVLGRR